MCCQSLYSYYIVAIINISVHLIVSIMFNCVGKSFKNYLVIPFPSGVKKEKLTQSLVISQLCSIRASLLTELMNAMKQYS